MVINPNAALMTTDPFESPISSTRHHSLKPSPDRDPAINSNYLELERGDPEVDRDWIISIGLRLSWSLSKGNISLDREETLRVVGR